MSDDTRDFNGPLVHRIATEGHLLSLRGYSDDTIDAVSTLALNWQQVELPPRHSKKEFRNVKVATLKAALAT